MRHLALCLALACAAPEYVARARPQLKSTAGVAHGEGAFENGGVKLFEQWWKPTVAQPKAVLVIVHGLKDHSTRYAEFATLLAERGYEVRAFDLRGHGSSEGRRVWVESFDDYLNDLDAFVKRAPAGKPLFVLGHSMGGAIVTEWVLTRKPHPAGIILSAPALKADVSGFTKGSTRALAAIAPRLAVFSLDLDKFSRDPKVVQECKADPLVDPGNGPAHTAVELLKAIDHIQEHMGDFDAPLLDMHGSADVITPPEGSKELVERAKNADKTLKIYDGLYHDLLHEPEKQQVMKDVATWMDERVK